MRDDDAASVITSIVQGIYTVGCPLGRDVLFSFEAPVANLAAQ